MRDPSRIIPFCERLAELWSKVPDWRFGQLVSNTLGTDPFYMEDEDALRSMERFFHIQEVVKDDTDFWRRMFDDRTI